MVWSSPQALQRPSWAPLSPWQVHVLLALQVEGSQPPIFHIHRPATGRSRQNMSLQVSAGFWACCADPACHLPMPCC